MVRKRLVLLVIIFTVSICSLPAVDLAVTAGPISIFDIGGDHIPDGLYGQAGVRYVISPKLETELGIVTQCTPDPFETVGISALVGFNLLGPIEPVYFNMIADAGLLYLYETDTNIHHPMIHVRISPLVIGNPYYIERGRLFTVGGLYDLNQKTISLTFSTVLENWFIF